jgi:hypothetical protein
VLGRGGKGASSLPTALLRDSSPSSKTKRRPVDRRAPPNPKAWNALKDHCDAILDLSHRHGPHKSARASSERDACWISTGRVRYGLAP